MKEKGPWAPYPLSTQEKTVKCVNLISNGCVGAIGPRYNQADIHRDIKEPVQSCSLKIDNRDTWQKMGSGSRFSESLEVDSVFVPKPTEWDEKNQEMLKVV